jgi:CarD family transcriptional regulator, regulator of rRNA transcription
MTISIGNKIAYPGHGPCRVSSIVKKVIGGQLGSYYRLVSLDENAGEVFIPLDKTEAVGIRALMSKSDVSRVLGQLARPAEQIANWKHRDYVNLKRLSSGSACDLAEIVASLTELNDRRSLVVRERQTLERARKLLICEMSEVTGESRSMTAQTVDNALRTPTGRSSDQKVPHSAAALLQPKS